METLDDRPRMPLETPGSAGILPALCAAILTAHSAHVRRHPRAGWKPALPVTAPVLPVIAVLISLSLLLAGCGSADLPVVLGGNVTRPTPPPRPTARAIASGASRVLVPYRDPRHTYEMRRPQTWIVMDARTAPRFARALGDGVRFFEPITASDPDAGSAGKLWVEVLPVRPGSTPRQMLLAPFVASDYPEGLLKRMRLAPARLGGLPAYRLVTLASKTQATILLARWRDHYYRLTIFSPTIPAEVARALRTWRFIASSRPDHATTPTLPSPVKS